MWASYYSGIMLPKIVTYDSQNYAGTLGTGLLHTLVYREHLSGNCYRICLTNDGCQWLAIYINSNGKIFMTIYYLLYKAEKPSVCSSIHIFPRHADNSVECASIEARLARNDCYVFRHQQVCFLKFPGAIIFRQWSFEDTHVEKKRPLSKKASGSSPGAVIFIVNVVTFSGLTVQAYYKVLNKQMGILCKQWIS